MISLLQPQLDLFVLQACRCIKDAESAQFTLISFELTDLPRLVDAVTYELLSLNFHALPVERIYLVLQALKLTL